MARLIWVRHGVTLANQQKRYIGQLDLPLANEGRRQAQRLAAHLRDWPLDAVYASDLQRCLETAEIICQYHPHLVVCPAAELRELSFGEWEGRTYEQLSAETEAAVMRFYDDPWSCKPPGGESAAELFARLERFLQRLIRNHRADETVLCVSHRGVIDVFHALCLAQRRDALFSLQLQPCGVLHCQYDYQLGKWVYAAA